MPMTVTYTVIDGQIISENRGGTIRNYVPDATGNIIALTDDTGAITDRFTYWPYGELKSHTGPSPTPFKFQGEEGDHTDGNLIYER